jgi:hypothetical protein
MAAPDIKVAANNVQELEAVAAQFSKAPVATATAQAMRGVDVVEALPLGTPLSPTTRTNSEYRGIVLPSLFLFYGFKELAARAFHVEEIAKIYSSYMAQDNSGSRLLVEAIGATLSQDVMKLTVGDFWFLMYWHRLNSYKRNPFVVTFHCYAEDHHTQVNEGKLAPETLKNQVTIEQSSLKLITLDQSFKTRCDEFEQQTGLRFTPELVEDWLYIEENRDELSPQQEFLIRYASRLEQNDVQGHTLKERCDFLLNKPDLEIGVLHEMEDRLIGAADHGVEETITTECGVCHAPIQQKLVVGALNFLPGYL